MITDNIYDGSLLVELPSVFAQVHPTDIMEWDYLTQKECSDI